MRFPGADTCVRGHVGTCVCFRKLLVELTMEMEVKVVILMSRSTKYSFCILRTNVGLVRTQNRLVGPQKNLFHLESYILNEFLNMKVVTLHL